jgi:hypothetical protein
VLTDALVNATNVWPKIVRVGTVPFAHRAATIGMAGGDAARHEHSGLPRGESDPHIVWSGDVVCGCDSRLLRVGFLHLGRGLGYGWGSVFFIMAFGCLIGIQFAVRSSPGLSVALLHGLGLSLGSAVPPIVVYYVSADPQALWQAGGATALFVAGCGDRRI